MPRRKSTPRAKRRRVADDEIELLRVIVVALAKAPPGVSARIGSYLADRYGPRKPRSPLLADITNGDAGR